METIWTGPWIIEYIINNTSLIITDPNNGNQKRVSFDRIRIYNKFDYGVRSGRVCLCTCVNGQKII